MLGTEYVPLHVLCKSHTCEKLDESCVGALVEIEMKIKLADMIVKRQPRLKSFLRQNRCITIFAMNALRKLVAQEESGKPAALSKDFDRAVDDQGLAKS